MKIAQSADLSLVNVGIFLPTLFLTFFQGLGKRGQNTWAERALGERLLSSFDCPTFTRIRKVITRSCQMLQKQDGVNMGTLYGVG